VVVLRVPGKAEEAKMDKGVGFSPLRVTETFATSIAWSSGGSANPVLSAGGPSPASLPSRKL
jgi:hypothetical protein